MNLITKLDRLTAAITTIVGNYETLAGGLLDARELIPFNYYPYCLEEDMSKALSFLAYACKYPARRKRVPMDVNDMVEKWIAQIKTLAVAHDVDEKDAASSKLDELLLPVVAAPVAQIREFYQKLVAEMKVDKSVPWAVWKMFEFWGANILDKITTEQELVLKKDLATKIAERSVKQIPVEDWMESMVGALMWRSKERLQAVDAALDTGETPRVKGKESCLFMTVGEAEVML